jgi:hypothetical protein
MKGSRGDWFLYTPRPFSVENLPQLSPVFSSVQNQDYSLDKRKLKAHKGRRLPWRQSEMTLCIAAACRHKEENRIVLCSDMKIGTWAAKAEIGFKVRWARANWPALISGDMSKAARLVKTFSTHLNGVELNSDNVFDAMQNAANIFREKLADDIVRRNFGISSEYLRKNKGKFPASKVVETYAQISEIDSGVEMIVVGFIGPDAYIFIVERDCTVEHRTNFAAIGTGAYIAEPALYQRGQHWGTPLPKTLYHAYEAKRLGQIAEGVGSFTVLMAIAPPKNGEIRYLMVSENTKQFLEEKYKEYGLKPTDDLDWEAEGEKPE